MVLRNDPEPRLRENALTYLSELSWDVVSPVIKETSKADRDPRVREKAEYILKSHEARELKSPSESVIRKRVAELMGYILKRAEVVTSDGKAMVQIVALPSNEDIEEVRRYGDAAVPILAEYLTSGDGRQKVLAMRFLGNLGGSRIVEPLRTVVQHDASPGIRDLALRWLSGAPWDLAAPIIREAAETDPDPGVREAAKEILAKYPPK